MALIAASVVTVLLCSLVSRRVEKTWLTAPILFAASATDGTSASAVLTRLLIEQLGYGALARALASHATGASMFIAAFAAGLATQWGLPDVGRQSVESTEAWCQLLNHFVFLLFGVLVARQWAHFGWPVVLYGVLSLTLVRMLPVAIALRGTGLARPTVLFMGAFGPRGLASIVLGLVYLERESRLADESTMRRAAMAKVLLSILAHGLAAQRGIRRHAATIAAFPASAPERRVPATDTEGSDTPQRRSP